ncbi:Acyl-CoA synthetase member 2 mitochondrial [Sparganum proliferum]
MGSPVSGLVSELVPQELEEIAFIQDEPVFWRRYVDDSFVIIKKDMLQHFHSLLNVVFSDIKFTIEEEQERQLPFLDVLVRRNLNGELETTNTTQLLSFHSNHPVAHKRSCVKTLSKRIQIHCSKPKDRAREARYLRDQFVQNGYPRAFISRCPRGRPQTTQTSTPPRIWHSLPYVKDVSEATERIAAELGVRIANGPKATMRNRVMKIKDRSKPEEQS